MIEFLASFLRTESKVRKANDDGIWELLNEAADRIERLEKRNDELLRQVQVINPLAR